MSKFVFMSIYYRNLQCTSLQGKVQSKKKVVSDTWIGLHYGGVEIYHLPFNVKGTFDYKLENSIQIQIFTKYKKKLEWR